MNCANCLARDEQLMIHPKTGLWICAGCFSILENIKFKPGVIMDNIQDTLKERLPVLKEREKEYGNFNVTASIILYIRGYVYTQLSVRHPHKNISPVIMEAFTQICTKLGRLIMNPWHKDSWKDIIGYATLVLEELEF